MALLRLVYSTRISHQQLRACFKHTSSLHSKTVATRSLTVPLDQPIDYKQLLLETQRPKNKSNQLLNIYSRLGKARLTSLILITTGCGYLLAPGANQLISITSLIVGTALSSTSANSLNQLFEQSYDSQMNRTKSRPLVQRQLSEEHALAFAAICGMSGVAVLYTFLNPITAALSAGNIALYAFVYTPLKRHSIGCTWVGAVVGSVPLLMAWTAKTSGEIGLGGLLLAAILYTWQFPHFNALSWNSKSDYSRAGFRMMSVTHPDLCRRVALRHSILLTAICLAAPLSADLSLHWSFGPVSLLFNGPLVYLAVKFYRLADASSSRRLFFYSTLVQLPAIMSLMLLFKYFVS